MSTFLGLLQEIPGISIDCFDEDNLNSSAFFLSHCHQDHMKGLKYDFFEHLRRKNLYFYCSHLSKSFLKNTFFNLDSSFVDKHLIELPLDDARIISFKHRNKEIFIRVTCISSGHCPGSVMFLFDYDNKRILYTGDFRINEQDFSKIKSLHYSKSNTPLNIDKVYLDTTFLNLNFASFPSRSDSLKELCNAVKEWFHKDPRNIIILETSAIYGSEYVYIELSKHLNKKIHVRDKVYEVYSRIDILSNCVTNIGEVTPIHACMGKMESFANKGLKCRQGIDLNNILTIVLSAQKWAGKDTSKVIEWDSIRKQTKNICYSTHASCNELKAFISHFKPKEVFPCVCHEKNEKEIHDLLDKFIKYDSSDNELGSHEDFELDFTNCETPKSKKFKSKIFSDDESDI